MYESPINAIQKTISQQMRQEEDKWIYEIEQQVGFHIDKQELIKALNYDRNSYHKGWSDACEKFLKTGCWIPIDDEPHEDYECDCCGYIISMWTANIEPHTEYKYCPSCGAKMEQGEEV